MTKKWGRIFKYNPKSTNNNNDDEDDNNKQFDYIKTLKYTTDKINKQKYVSHGSMKLNQ